MAGHGHVMLATERVGKTKIYKSDFTFGDQLHNFFCGGHKGSKLDNGQNKDVDMLNATTVPVLGTSNRAVSTFSPGNTAFFNGSMLHFGAPPHIGSNCSAKPARQYGENRYEL